MIKPRKAAIVTHFPVETVGGIERYNFYLKQLLEDYDYHVDIYCKNDLPRTISLKLCSKLIPQLEEYYFLARIIKKQIHQYDLVITNNTAGGMLRSGPNCVYNISHGIFVAGLSMFKMQNRTGRLDIIARLNVIIEELSKQNKKGIIACFQSRQRRAYQILQRGQYGYKQWCGSQSL